MSHRKVEEYIQEREGIQPQGRLLNELQRNDSSEEEEDAEAGKCHVAVYEAHTLHLEGITQDQRLPLNAGAVKSNFDHTGQDLY